MATTDASDPLGGRKHCQGFQAGTAEPGDGAPYFSIGRIARLRRQAIEYRLDVRARPLRFGCARQSRGRSEALLSQALRMRRDRSASRHELRMTF